MAEETKITVKVGLIAAATASLVVFILGMLFAHQGDISILKVEKAHMVSRIEEIHTLSVEIRNDQRRREEKEILNQERLETHIKGDNFRKSNRKAREE